MTKRRFYFILLLFYTAAVLALVGRCNGEVSPVPQQEPRTDVHLASVPQVQAPTAQAVPETPAGAVLAVLTTAPPAICALIDFTGSVKHFGIAKPTVQDFMPVVDLLDRIGGELAVGSIHDRPSDPLLRLRIDPPETPPLPSSSGDVFTRNKQRRAYRRALPAYRTREEERRARNQELVSDFRARLEKFVERARTAPNSDLWSSLRRCETFLLEAHSTRTKKTASPRFIVAISDGRHNVKTSLFRPIHKTISVLAVSGVAGLGDFSRLNDVRYFEAPSAAFLFIINSVEAQ